MSNTTTRESRSLKRLVLRLMCRVFGHKYIRTECIGSMRIESSRTCDGEPMCYRCHPTPTLAEEIAEQEKSENRCIPTPVLDSDKGATKTDKNQSKS